MTVLPTDLTKALDEYAITYAGPLSGELVQGRMSRRDVTSALTFKLDRSALFCHDAQGQSVSFGATDLQMYVSDVDVSHHLDLGGLIHRPSLDVALAAEVTTRGTFSVQGASTCKIKDAWANAHRKVFLLSGGSTLSFGPAFEFSVSGKGAFKILDRTRTTWAVDAELGKTPKHSETSRSVEHEVGGALTFTATLAAGVSIRLGMLDRAGLEGKIMLGVAASLRTVGVNNICITAKLVLKLSLGLYLDAWVSSWESRTISVTFDLFTFVDKCVVPEPDPPAQQDEPDITSARLPDATVGEDYEARLTTADDRGGRWSIVRYALPAGLVLDGSSGVISGTPTAAVGDYPVIVDFTDNSNQVATTVIRIRVLPTTGLGGGDIQITLQWSGPADLDLHVLDPANEEIYYRHTSSESGGQLDHDANAGCNGPADDDNPVENVFWPPHSAPAGSYLAWVDVYRVCDGALDWHLTVRRNGVVIVDESGTGDSTGYAFSVGSAGRAGGKVTGTAKPPARSYPAK